MPQIYEENFQTSINQVIKKGRHADYFKEVLREYEDYKVAFSKIFTDKNSPDDIYKFRVIYLLKKPVWRDIEILGKQTFLDLAEEVIDSMGWMNDHMHGFDIPETETEPDPFVTGSSKSFFAPGWIDDPHPTYKTDEIRICDIDYDELPKLNFIFDFGDGHRFNIEFKGNCKKKKEDKKSDFPKIIDQRGVGPEQYPDYG